MSDDLKLAIIKPLGSELFLGKLIERIAALQIVNHLQANNLMDIFQSAYRKYHSTETALLRVQNDILMHLDKSDTVMLVLLDLSAAFVLVLLDLSAAFMLVLLDLSAAFVLVLLKLLAAVMLILLDLSAAFDTIDHEILFIRMEKRCGTRNNILKFLKSYLTNRKQKVVIGDNESTARDLKYGVLP